MSRETEDYLSRCVVDTLGRKFYLYSSEGNEKIIECQNVGEFMNVLGFVREQLKDKDNVLAYSDPL